VLTAIKKEELPEVLRTMNPAEMKAHIETMQKKRSEVQKQVAEIGRKRDAFVAAERKQRAGAGEKLFEEAILESVREQARSRGFVRQPTPKLATPEVETPKLESPKQEPAQAEVPKQTGQQKAVVESPAVEIPAAKSQPKQTRQPGSGLK
jgi:hypothetical protein